MLGSACVWNEANAKTAMNVAAVFGLCQALEFNDRHHENNFCSSPSLRAAALNLND